MTDREERLAHALHKILCILEECHEDLDLYLNIPLDMQLESAIAHGQLALASLPVDMSSEESVQVSSYVGKYFKVNLSGD